MTDNKLRQAIQKLLDSHTFSDQTAYSPALQEDLLMSLEALIRQDRRELQRNYEAMFQELINCHGYEKAKAIKEGVEAHEG